MGALLVVEDDPTSDYPQAVRLASEAVRTDAVDPVRRTL